MPQSGTFQTAQTAMAQPAIPAGVSWAWPVSGWALTTAAAGVLLWSLFADRSRARRRCPRCWYDMAGAGPAPVTCPECGKTAKSEQALFRTRRRWRTAALAIIVAMLSTQLIAQPDRGGEPLSVRFIPSTVLCLLARHGDQDWYAALPEWQQRIQYAAWYRPMRSWQRALAEVVAMPLTRDDVRRMFINTPWTWRENEPEVVEVYIVDKALGTMGARQRMITITPVDAPEAEVVVNAGWQVIMTNSIGRYAKGVLTLPNRPAGAYTDRFDFVIRDEGGWVIGRWRVEFESHVVPR